MKKVILVLILGVLVGCSDGLVDFESEGIEGRVSDGKLTIFNKFDDPIYYFAIEREIAARTYWIATSGDENRIKARSTKRILFNNISGYNREDEILLYYWTGKDPGSGDIKNIVIKTD